MVKENLLTVIAANLVGVPFRLFSPRSIEAPSKALILKPCSISQVMMATPLLSALSDAYPQASFDWASSDWARPAISGNPLVGGFVDTGRVLLADGTWDDVKALIERLRPEQYDTCFIPSRSAILSYVAWQAGIPQRIGLNASGRGFAQTLPVKLPKSEKQEAEVYLSLAESIGINAKPDMAFYPSDRDRSRMTGRLVEGIGWDGVMPLAVLHPGGGRNPVRMDESKRWPAERFALLGSQLMRKYGARVLLVGSEDSQELAETILGMISTPVVNLTGQLSLGELGALCEMADLYVGNDTGPTQIAVAMGCPTLAIFGPTDPSISGPWSSNGKVRILQAQRGAVQSSWEGASADDAVLAARELLGLPPDHIAPNSST